MSPLRRVIEVFICWAICCVIVLLAFYGAVRIAERIWG